MIYYITISVCIFVGLRIFLKVVSQEPITRPPKGHHKRPQLFKLIAPFIKLNESTLMAIEKKLKKISSDLTSEEFIAQGVIKISPFIAIAVFLMINKNIFIGLYLLFVAGFLFYAHYNKLKSEVIRIRDETIEELPELMSYLTNSLKVDKDISKILEDYKGAAGPALENELEQLRADLKTGNIDMALFDFDIRVNISHLSNYIGVVRATLNGEIQYAALESITKDMEEYENENAKKNAKKIPGKIRRASFAVGVSVILFYLTIMLYAIKIGVDKF